LPAAADWVHFEDDLRALPGRLVSALQRVNDTGDEWSPLLKIL
jgi:hypothetical protein